MDSVPYNNSAFRTNFNNTSAPGSTAGGLNTGHLVTLTLIYGVSCVMGTVGNALVLLIIARCREFHDFTHAFVASLSVSDFLVCALYQPMMIQQIYHRDKNNTIYLRITIEAFATVTAAANLLAVTVERFIKLQFSLHYYQIVTWSRSLTCIAFTWVLSLGFGLAEALGYGKVAPVIRTVVCATCVLILIMLYIRIAFIIRYQARKIHSRSIAYESSENVRQEHKTTKAMLSYVVPFVITWVPYLIWDLYVTPNISTDPEFKKNAKLYAVVFMYIIAFLTLNSAVNSYIYCWKSEKFRSKLKEILRRE